MCIALGFFLVGFLGGSVPIWGVPILMLPAYIGSNLFNTANNALVMNTLQENLSFASGMLETNRRMGHTVGTTISATVLGLALPAAIALLPSAQAQIHYRDGFQIAALVSRSAAFVAGGRRFPLDPEAVMEPCAVPDRAAPRAWMDQVTYVKESWTPTIVATGGVHEH